MQLLVIATLAILASARAEEPVDAEFDGASSDVSTFANGITFTLFTRLNPLRGQNLVLNVASSVANSNFARLLPTRIITHGWRGDQSSISVTLVRNAYLSAGNDNIIVVDWNSIQETISNPYATAREGGAAIAAFITFMQSSAGLNLATTTLVAHSLGAHVMGIAGRTVRGTIQSLVALDPAGGTLWENAITGINLGVQPRDAAHVQVIHTNGGEMGLMRATGDSDFYPNGGTRQPGCTIDTAGVCSHFRAAYFFAESIGNPNGFRAIEDSRVFMGGRNLRTNARGRYTLNTNGGSPFARG